MGSSLIISYQEGKDSSSMTPTISFLMFYAKAFNYIQAKIIIII
jgi:hypothetical protein